MPEPIYFAAAFEETLAKSLAEAGCDLRKECDGCVYIDEKCNAHDYDGTNQLSLGPALIGSEISPDVLEAILARNLVLYAHPDALDIGEKLEQQGHECLIAVNI